VLFQTEPGEACRRRGRATDRMACAIPESSWRGNIRMIHGPHRASRSDDDAFSLAGERIPPGSWKMVAIPVAPAYNPIMVNTAAHVFCGVRPGPRLWISGAIHGDELCGVIIVREVARRIDPRRLAGTLIAIPTVNQFGVLHQSRYLPDRRDLNRCFP